MESWLNNNMLERITKDEFLNEDRIANEIARAHSLFKNSINILPFNGVHEFNKSIIEKIVQ